MSRKLAAIYARVSTAKQAAEELPIASQIDQCRTKCAALGADVAKVFTDAGISGRDESRPAFQEAITYCIDHRLDYLVTWSTSRFSRERVTAGLYKRKLRRAGVQIIYCTTDIDASTDAGFILESVLEIIDEAKSRQVSADTRRSMIHNARAGHWNGGNVPFGYEAIPAPNNAKRKSLQPLPAEAWIVNRMFDMRLQGRGVRQIALELNTGGHTNRGRRWHASTILEILRNPAVTGHIVFNRRDNAAKTVRPRHEWILVPSHPPVVTQAKFDEVQQLMEADAPEVGGSSLSNFLFTGVLVCGRCGASMQIETAKGRSHRYSYYNCSAWLKNRDCQQQRRPAPEVDNFLMAAIRDRVFTREMLTQVAAELNEECGRAAVERRQRIKALRGEINIARRRRQKLLDVLELMGVDAPNLAEIGPRIRELAQQIEQHEATIRELEETPAPSFSVADETLEELADALRRLVEDRTDVKRSRLMLQRLVSRVVVHSDRAEIDYRTEFLNDMNRRKLAVHSSVDWLPEPNALGTRRVVVGFPERLRRAA